MRPLAVALFLSLVVPLHAAVPIPGDGWSKLTAGDFVIYSHAPDSAAIDIADRLLTFRSALSLITRYKVEAPEPVTVIVFRTYYQMLPYADAAIGHKQDVGAMTFHERDGGDTILINGDQWRHSVGPEVYHELTHSFTARSNATLPLWFTEGIAEFYSTFDVVRGEVKIGYPPERHMRWLRARGLITPLAKLLAADHNSTEYQGGSWTDDFYAESWLLVHYLLLGNPERGKAAGQFLTLLAAKQPPDRACSLAFGIPLDQLETELRKYMAQGTLSTIHYAINASNKSPIGVPGPVPREEVMYAIGNVLAQEDASREDGRNLLEEALKLNPNRPETLAALGALADNAKPGSGDAMFEKAVANDNAKAIVYRRYGKALVNRQTQAVDPTLAKRAREMFTKAVALNPRVAEAHIGLGITYLMLPGDPKPGIAALEKGLELDPQNTDAALNLVTLLVRSGDREAANAVIDKHIAPYADAELLRRARDLIEKK